MNLTPYLDFTRELAAAAADVILPYYGQAECGLESKDDDSPVTLADRGAEEVMRAMIEKKFPVMVLWAKNTARKTPMPSGCGFWTRLTAPSRSSPRFRCLERSSVCFTTASRSWGASTSRCWASFCWATTRPQLLMEKQVCVRSTARIDEALLLTTDPLRPYKVHDGAAYEKLVNQARTVRSWGDCYGYLLLSCGWADIMLDPIMAAWDLLPLIPCVQGAGAKVSAWDGTPIPDFDPARGGDKMFSCIAATPALHPQIVEILGGGG